MKIVYPPTNTVCGGYNYDGLDSMMLHTKFRGNQSGGENVLRDFTIYECGGHLRHVTLMQGTNFHSPYP